MNTSFIPKLAGILEAAKTGWLPQCCPLHSTCIFFVPVYSRGLPHHSCSHAQRTAGACTLQVARPLLSPNISSPDHCSGAAAIPTPLDEHPHPLARLTSLRGQRDRLRQVNCPHLLGGAAPAAPGARLARCGGGPRAAPPDPAVPPPGCARCRRQGWARGSCGDPGGSSSAPRVSVGWGRAGEQPRPPPPRPAMPQP